jgi:hypothetical protein
LKNNPKLKKLSLPKNLIGKLAQILTLEIRNNLEQEARNKAQL